MKPNFTDPKPVDGFDLYPRSLLTWGGTSYFLAQDCATLHKYLGIRGDVTGFSEPEMAIEDDLYYLLNAQNARVLRQRLPWMSPHPGGLRTSFGFGDRLGLASSGHALAAWEARLYPIFAQQSVRENARTGRTPQQVLDDAMWGIFQTGWGKPWGADADHLKSPADLEAFVQAGYTFYTVDPGEFVGRVADPASIHDLKEKVTDLPWTDLQSTPAEVVAAYLGKRFLLDGVSIELDEMALLRALAKYGGAIAHTTRMYRALQERLEGKIFDFEVSVDETDSPTSVAEHFLIASELRRLGVQWNSLAPRFPGRFEKGVDFIGDMARLERELAQHAAVMRHFGNYKLSLHSGSDKFSVYALLAQHAGKRVHVKTAGTSYLEALRVTAALEPGFFRQVLDFSRARYETDRATYHVSAVLARVPAAAGLKDSDLPALLDEFHARQVLHVTFGSVLGQFGRELKGLLERHEAAYSMGLQAHFKRHLDPFAR
jgi:hypothetical protein